MKSLLTILAIAVILAGCSTIEKSTGPALDPVTGEEYNVERISD